MIPLFSLSPKDPFASFELVQRPKFQATKFFITSRKVFNLSTSAVILIQSSSQLEMTTTAKNTLFSLCHPKIPLLHSHWNRVLNFWPCKFSLHVAIHIDSFFSRGEGKKVWQKISKGGGLNFFSHTPVVPSLFQPYPAVILR